MSFSGLRMPAFRRRHLSILVALGCASVHADPDVRPVASEVLGKGVLSEVVVSANRRETVIEDATATVTAVGREQLDRRQPRDEADLFRDEPDVAMSRDMRRFGATSVNIRGVEDNRVIQAIDGFRQPDFYNGGGVTNFTMAAVPGVMPDFLRQVEVVRGAASSMYGSDALGGVVGYVTLDPADIARDKAMALRVRGGVSNVNEGWSGSVLGALRSDTLELLLGYGEGGGEEVDNQGDNYASGPARSKPNPLQADDQGALVKVIYKPVDGHKVTAAYEARSQDVETDVRRIPSSLPRVSAMNGADSVERERFSLEYQHAPEEMFYDRLTVRFDRQDADTHNRNEQTRSNTSATCSGVAAGANTCFLEQDFFLSQTNEGMGVQLESVFQAIGAEHLLSYGVDLQRQKVINFRDATRYNLTLNTVSKNIAGDVHPMRDFANGDTRTIGVYVQDDLRFSGLPSWTFVPGVRFDSTHLTPEVDALAQAVLTANGKQAVEQKHSGVSPKLGVQWKIGEVLTGFGQLSGGFRAPNYAEVNGSFRNSTMMYGSVPNPDLKAERSVGVELGLRARTASTSGQIAVFDNRYRNFIENVKLNCPADPMCITGLTTYASKNIADVRIYGAEVRGGWEFADNWRLDGAMAYARGSNEEAELPLNSIEPLRMTLGLAYDKNDWGAEGRVRMAEEKDHVDDTTNGVYFRTPRYAVADLSAWVRPTQNTRIIGAINNLFDEKYWLWSDIRRADGTNPQGVDFYTQPGRHYRVSFQLDF